MGSLAKSVDQDEKSHSVLHMWLFKITTVTESGFQYTSALTSVEQQYHNWSIDTSSVPAQNPHKGVL